jgi:hypothetical protein
MSTALYRAYDAADRQLYVGITDDLWARMKHQAQRQRHSRLPFSLDRSRRQNRTAMDPNAQAPAGRGRPAITPDDGLSKPSASTIQHDQAQPSSPVRQRESAR